MNINNILYERKCVREDASVGGNVIKPLSRIIFNVTAYACVLSDTLSLQEDIRLDSTACIAITSRLETVYELLVWTVIDTNVFSKCRSSINFSVYWPSLWI